MAISLYLVGALEHEWIMTFHSVGNGMSSSQLTFTLILFRGVGIPSTRYNQGYMNRTIYDLDEMIQRLRTWRDLDVSWMNAWFVRYKR